MQTKIINVLFLSMFILCSIAHALNAGVPAKINFQGRLEESGQAVNGSRSMIFTIYDAEIGGSVIWTSQPSNVTVTNGLFSVNLETGTISNISTDTFKGSRYIEVSIEGVILSPRQEIISAPYALVAQTLSDNGCSDNQILKWDDGNEEWICSDSTAGSIADGEYLNDVKVSSAIYADSAGSAASLVSGDYLNNVRVSSAMYLDGNINVTQINAGALPATVYISSINTGEYLNDVRVSSSIYADNAETKVSQAGDTMSGALNIIGSSITVITADSMPSSLWVSTSAITPHLYISTSGNAGIGLANPHSKLQVAGPISTALITVIADYTITANDSIIVGDTEAYGGDITVTLPSAIGIKGRQYIIKSMDSTGSYALAIDTTNSETMDGQAPTYDLADFEVANFVSDGANWVVIGYSQP